MLLNYLAVAKDSTNTKKDKLSAVEKALNWSDKLEDSPEKRDLLSKIGVVYFRLKEYLKYKEVNKKSLEIAEKINDSFGIARSYHNIAFYYTKTGLSDSAFYFFHNSEKVYDKLQEKKPELHAEVLYNMAVCQRHFKDYVGSEANTYLAIQKIKHLKIHPRLYNSYNNLGIIAKNLGRYDDAIKNYSNALEQAKESNSKSREIQTLNNIGVVFKNRGDYEKAISYYQEALTNSRVLASKYKLKGMLIDNISYAKFLSGQKNGIVEGLLEGRRIRDSVDDHLGLISSNIHLGEYYSSFGQDSLAIEYMLEARDQSKSLNSNKELLDVLLILSDLSKEKDRLKYAKEYIILTDSLQNQERINRDKFSRVKFETDEIKERNIQISKENQALISAVLGLTALFLLVYIIFRQQQSNKELLFAQSQQESNQEIYRLLLNQQVKLEEGRQIEQQRMSEELHDGVLGRLFGVRLSLDGINQRANDGFTEARTKYIEELKSIEKEIRLISHDLGTETLSPEVAYIDAVESLISDLCEAHEIDFEFENDEKIDWEKINDQKKINLFRILQESMQNIFKHAKAKMIKISFDYIDNNINLTILDDGIGFKANKVKKGIGLKNITSRVSQMSGVVDFKSNKNMGTTVAVSIPV